MRKPIPLPKDIHEREVKVGDVIVAATGRYGYASGLELGVVSKHTSKTVHYYEIDKQTIDAATGNGPESVLYETNVNAGKIFLLVSDSLERPLREAIDYIKRKQRLDLPQDI